MFDRNLCGGDPAKQAEYWYNAAMTATCTDAELRRVRAAWKKDREENDKLRELVRKVERYECLGCHDCPKIDGCDAFTLYDENCAMKCEIERDKRELGIEVD